MSKAVLLFLFLLSYLAISHGRCISTAVAAGAYNDFVEYTVAKPAGNYQCTNVATGVTQLCSSTAVGGFKTGCVYGWGTGGAGTPIQYFGKAGVNAANTCWTEARNKYNLHGIAALSELIIRQTPTSPEDCEEYYLGEIKFIYNTMCNTGNSGVICVVGIYANIAVNAPAYCF